MATTSYETLLIAALLKTPDWIETVPIESKAFGDPKCRQVFECLVDGAINTANLVQELENKKWKNVDAVKFVSTLVGIYPETPDLEVVQSYAARINEEYGKRTLVNQLTVIADEIPSIPLADSIGKISQLAISTQLESSTQIDPTGFGVIIRMVNQLQDGLQSKPFPSGLTVVDHNLASNGIKKRHVWLIAGQYKGYKSRTALHICNSALDNDKSVAYFGLEDDDLTFSTALIASRFGIPESAFEAFYRDELTPRKADVINAVSWLQDGATDHWRCYDRASGISKWKMFPAIVMADKMKYNTDLVVLDHIQLWSREYDVLSEITNMLMEVAQKADVAIIVISQVSNQTLREGAPSGMIATKGSGDLGAICHVGLEVYKPENAEFIAGSITCDAIKQAGTFQYMNSKHLVCEIGVHLKVVRKGNQAKTYVLFEPFSGKILRQGADPLQIDLK